MTPAGTPAPVAGQLGSATAVGLVAARELRTRLRSKAFLITTAVFVVLLVAGSVVIALVSGTTTPSTVGFAGPTAPLAGAVSAQAGTGHVQLRTAVVADEAAGRAELAAGRVYALVLGTPQAFRVVVDQQLDPGLGSVLGAVAHQQTLDGQVARLGGDPAQVRAAVDAATVPVQAVRPPQHVDGTRIGLGFVTGVLIYLALLVWGQAVAQGVVEEKSSRVVELLLAAVRPWQLMAGKVLGIGTVGLIQTATVGVVGVVAGLVTGALALPVASAAAAVGWLIVWYLLGFTAYALLFAALGALVSRQEDIASVTSPVLMVIVIPYVLGISVLPSNPTSPLIAVLSVIPLFSPTLMPIRQALGVAPGWEVGLAVALVVLLIPALVWLAGRVYSGAVLRVGSRVRLRDAIRSTSR